MPRINVLQFVVKTLHFPVVPPAPGSNVNYNLCAENSVNLSPRANQGANYYSLGCSTSLAVSGILFQTEVVPIVALGESVYSSNLAGSGFQPPSGYCPTSSGGNWVNQAGYLASTSDCGLASLDPSKYFYSKASLPGPGAGYVSLTAQFGLPPGITNPATEMHAVSVQFDLDTKSPPGGTGDYQVLALIDGATTLLDGKTPDNFCDYSGNWAHWTYERGLQWVFQYFDTPASGVQSPYANLPSTITFQITGLGSDLASYLIGSAPTMKVVFLPGPTQSYSARATTVFDVTSGSADGENANKYPCATTALTVVGVGTEYVPVSYEVFAANGIFLCYAPSPAFQTSILSILAYTSFVVSTAAVTINTFWAMRAGSSITFIAEAVGGSPSIHMSLATSGIRLTAPATAYLAGINTWAANAIVLSHSVNPASFVLVAAANWIALSPSATNATHNAWVMSAFGGLAMATTATNGLSAFLVAANSHLVAAAIASGRDFFLGATSAITVAPAPMSNRFFALLGADSFLVSTDSQVLVASPQAAGGVVFADLAVGSITLPWVRSSLTLPTGGTRPHS